MIRIPLELLKEKTLERPRYGWCARQSRYLAWCYGLSKKNMIFSPVCQTSRRLASGKLLFSQSQVWDGCCNFCFSTSSYSTKPEYWSGKWNQILSVFAQSIFDHKKDLGPPCNSTDVSWNIGASMEAIKATKKNWTMKFL